MTPSPSRSAAPAALSLSLALLVLPAALAAQERSERGPELSGVLFGNYQYHVEDGPREAGNEFVLERAYLTLRAGAGERASVRLTSDLFRNGAEGYDLRVKYGYLQYDVHRGERTSAFVRAGILQTVEIEHEESFWPRWIGSVSTDRFRFFSSADAGVSGGVTLPGRMGEVYATITNGRGYQNAFGDDRFKDFAARVTLTPLAAREGAGILRGLTISPWYYKGDTASRFGPGRSESDLPDDDLGTIGSGRRRDRYGVFGGLRDDRLTIGLGLAEYRREEESGENTARSPVVVTERTARLATALVVARPFALADASSRVPLGVVLRYDRYEPDARDDAHVHFAVAGLTWDVNPRISVALDYQEQLPRRGASPVTWAPSQVYYLHLVARF